MKRTIPAVLAGIFLFWGGPASARYYEASTGRFLQEDPILLPMQVINTQTNTPHNQFVWLLPRLIGDPTYQHPYTYAANNPLSNTDPYGLLYGIPAGELYGEDAAQYWADLYEETDNPLYWVPGGLASLWTPCTSDKTFTTLTTAYTIRVFGPFPTRGVPGSLQRWRYYFRFDPPHHGKGWEFDGSIFKWLRTRK